MQAASNRELAPGASTVPVFVLPGVWPSGGISRRTGLRTPGPFGGVGVQLSPWSLIVRGVDWRQDPARSHKPSHVGSNPTSATLFSRQVRDCSSAEYANRQSDQVESLVIDCGFDSRLGYWWRRAVSGWQERQARAPRRLSPGRRLAPRASGLQVLRRHTPFVRGKTGFESRADLCFR